MNSLPYVSIGLPFYNVEKYLEDAICSVLAQSFNKWELIMIDDGSTDNSLEIAKYYSKLDNRIKVISDGYNKKLPARLNQIIRESKYDYIARMDADDLMSNDRIEKQLKILETNPNIDLVTTGYLTIDNTNHITGIRIYDNNQMDAKSILNGKTNLLHASLLARKDWCLRNQYNEAMIQAEDYHLWLSASLKKDLRYQVIEEPLYWYRVIENINYNKMLNGYNTQIEIINSYYKGVLPYLKKLRITNTFEMKKMAVKILDKLNLIEILLKLRANEYSSDDFNYYMNHYQKIIEQRL